MFLRPDIPRLLSMISTEITRFFLLTALTLLVLSCNQADEFAVNDEFMAQSVITAHVEELVIEELEDSPDSLKVVANGFFPDGCTQIDEIETERVGNIFDITITTTRDEDAGCTLSLVPFTMSFALDVTYLPEGIYTVIVNDVSTQLVLE